MSQSSSRLDIGSRMNVEQPYCEVILNLHVFTFQKGNFINEINGTLRDSCTVFSFCRVLYVYQPRGQLSLVETPLDF